MSFQDFRHPVERLAHWREETGMPVLRADGAKGIPAEGGDDSLTDGDWYAGVLAGPRENPGAVGAHLRGAYIRNNSRRRGLLNPREQPDQPAVTAIREAIRQTATWIAGA